MKKRSVVVIIIGLIMVIFLFHNMYTLFKHYETTGITNPLTIKAMMEKFKRIFSYLSLVGALALLGAGIYLVYLFKKEKEVEAGQMPPLQDYLLQLQTNQDKLKNIVETQQEKVTQKEELNKCIINNIQAAVIFINISGRIEIFNKVAENLFAQKYVNARNNVIEKILAAFPQLVDFINQHKTVSASGEVTAGERIFSIYINPIDKVGTLLLVIEVTEERRREEIERSNSNFVMLGEMAAFLAHEIRNSLGVIFGYAKTIKTETEKVEKINREIHFLTHMMETFLNFSRPISIEHRESIDLTAMIKTIGIEKGIAVDLPVQSYYLESDPVLVHAVFANLLLNAGEAGADRIEITCNQIEKPRALEVYIKDNGKGISPGNLEKIWFPFFTTKEKGTGMGLPSIRKIVGTMKGEIVLLKSDAVGTEFKIVFYR